MERNSWFYISTLRWVAKDILVSRIFNDIDLQRDLARPRDTWLYGHVTLRVEGAEGKSLNCCNGWRYNCFSLSHDLRKSRDQRVMRTYAWELLTGLVLLSLSTRFGTHRNRRSREIMFLVTEEQDSIWCRLNLPLKFVPEEQGILCSHTQNFTINRTLTKIFASVYNEKGPI